MGKLFSKKKKDSNSGFDALDSVAAPSRVDPKMNQYTGNTQIMVREKTPVHTDAVVSLAPVQPGLCISGSKDKTVALYDYHNHRLEDRWTSHERDITKVCYGVHCGGIFSASRDKSIKLWKRGNPHAVREYNGHELVVSAIHLNTDNTMLCSGSRDNTIKLWDVESGSCLRENRTSRNLVTDVKFVPASNLLIQTGEDKEVRLFDTRSMTISHNFPRKQYIQMCCDVSADGAYCLTCSNGFGGSGCEATLWDLRTLSIVHEYKGHSEAVEACIFLPLQDRPLLWDLRTLSIVHEYKGHLEAVEACIFLPHQDRPLIATSSRDCSVKVWDRDTKDLIATCLISCSGPLTSIIAYEDNSMCVSSFNEGIHELRLSVPHNRLQQISKF